MVKADLIKAMSDQTGIDKDTTLKILEEFMTTVKSSVSNGDEVILRRFGTFKNILRHQKNFRTSQGKWILIPEHYEVALKYCADVKELVK